MVRILSKLKVRFEMGEFAIRKSDGERVKIGTCETMYYIRFEERHKVTAIEGNVDPMIDYGLLYRPPFTDEDDIKIGDYEPFRGEKLINNQNEYFKDVQTTEDPGQIYIRHESGIRILIPCYHGEQLIISAGEFTADYNTGKAWAFQLVHLKNTREALMPIVECRFCSKMWRYDWKDISDYVQPFELRQRISALVEGYLPQGEK